MNKLSKYILFLLFSALASCSSDDDAMSTSHPVMPHPGDALELTVSAHDFMTDGAPDTRATDEGKTTTFENGDCVGIIILDGYNNLIYNNIPYKYDSSSKTWGTGSTEKGGCYYDPNAYTYIVYYPYSPDADNCKSESDLQAKFKPRANQSSKGAYRASDLMVYTTSGTPLKSITAALKHVYGSVSLAFTAEYILGNGENCIGSYDPTDISDVNLTVGNDMYVLYKAADGTLRCILPTGITPGETRCFYTIGSNAYGYTINIGEVESNTRYITSSKIVNKVNYNLDNARVGDFYCKMDDGTGYLIPGDATLTPEQVAACIGIVYSTDINRIGSEAKKKLTEKGVLSPHGLVMALTNAYDNKDKLNTGCSWGQLAHQYDQLQRTSTLEKQYNNVDGYAETKRILNEYVGNALLESAYSAFYHAGRYGTEKGGTLRYAAPDNTTGWFIPSMGQWWDILSNLGKMDLSGYQASVQSKAIIPDASLPAINNIDTYLKKIDHAKLFRTGTFNNAFWSSSEWGRDHACYVKFRFGPNDKQLYLDYTFKDNPVDKVRCVFAF